MFNRYFAAAIFAFSLSGCGGGGGGTAMTSEPPVVTIPTPAPTPDPTPEPLVYTGMFLDSAVENLNYSTPSTIGVTNADGEFSYQANEAVTFSIGAIEFPSVAGDVFVTPLNVFSTEAVNSTAVVNMLRLLQSLDFDGDPTNGIQIPSAAHDLAQALTVDFSDSEFDSIVANLVQMSGALNQQLITAQDAIFHFQQTLDELGEQTSICAKTHPMVGYSGFFESFAHNVSGLATIVDDCTIKVSNFDYDGGGPIVYVYAGKDHDYASVEAFSIGQRIDGQTYEDAELIFRLPSNKTLDDLNGLSVWCVDFSADFGHMTFMP